MAMGETDSKPASERQNVFVVCGLVELGRQCAILLKEFRGFVIGIEGAAGAQDATQLGIFDEIVTGDCRKPHVLLKAHVDTCRAVLIVGDDERSNIATAFEARALNPRARIVIRSAQNKLNELLVAQLGNLAAFEPHDFAARAFAVASLGDETKARFELNDRKVQVVTHEVKAGDWCDGRTPWDLTSSRRRILSHVSGNRILMDLFSLQSAEEGIGAGDVLNFVELREAPEDAVVTQFARRKRESIRRRLAEALRRTISAAPWVALVSLLTIVLLATLGIFLYRAENPEVAWFDAINIAAVLAVGGFDNVFAGLKMPFRISPGLYVYSLLMKIFSAIFLGIVIATLTEKVLGARFQIAARRPLAPSEDHTIVVGMGPIGRNVANMLRQWSRPTAGVTEHALAEDVLRGLPIESGPIEIALERANVGSARSVVITGDDQVANLETTLLARSLNPHCNLVFRAADRELARAVAALVPRSAGICDIEIAAQAITGAAFDETILTAFDLAGRTVLVTEYLLKPGDGLVDRQLAELAYGYGIAPLTHERDAENWRPTDDVRLQAGDKIVVLATVDALRRIEHGELQPPTHRLFIENCRGPEVAFEAGNIIARIAGCDLSMARRTLSELPCELRTLVYKQPGSRLVRELRNLGVTAHLVASQQPLQE